MAVVGLLMGAGVLLYRQFARVTQKTMASLETREALSSCLQLLSDRVKECNSSGLRVSAEKPARCLSLSSITGLSTQGNLTWSDDLSLFWFDTREQLMGYRICRSQELQALPLASDGTAPVAPSPTQMVALVQAPQRTLRRFALEDAFFDWDPSGLLRVTLKTRKNAKSMTITRAFSFKL